MEPEPEPEPWPQLESSSDSEDDSDDFQSVQGDEQLMQDFEDEAEGLVRPQCIGSWSSRHSSPSPALSPPAIAEGLVAHAKVLEADLRQQQLDLDSRRRFLSLRPVFRDIYTMFSSGKDAGADANGGVEPSTMKGLAETLFPRSAPYERPASATPLVSWVEFTAFAEATQHIPRDDAEWEQLCAPFPPAATLPSCRDTCGHLTTPLNVGLPAPGWRSWPCCTCLAIPTVRSSMLRLLFSRAAWFRQQKQPRSRRGRMSQA